MPQNGDDQMNNDGNGPWERGEQAYTCGYYEGLELLKGQEMDKLQLAIFHAFATKKADTAIFNMMGQVHE